MLAAVSIPSPLVLVPQECCIGTRASRRKMCVWSCIHDPKMLSNISTWKLSGVAACCFSACCTLFHLSVARHIVSINTTLWIIKPGHCVHWSYMSPVSLLAGSTMYLACIIISRQMKKWLDFTKPIDEQYKIYLDNLENNDLKNIAKIIETTGRKLGRNNITRTLIDTFIQKVMDRDILSKEVIQETEETFLYKLHLLRCRLKSGGFAVSPEVRNAICERYAQVMKTHDAYRTSCLITTSILHTAYGSLYSVPRGIGNKPDKVALQFRQRVAEIFKEHAENELKSFPANKTMRQVLDNNGSPILPRDIQRIIEQYMDDKNKRIERVYVYAIQTTYQMSAGYQNLDVFNSLIQKTALYLIDNSDPMDIDEAIVLLEHVLPRTEKTFEIITKILSNTQYFEDTPETQAEYESAIRDQDSVLQGDKARNILKASRRHKRHKLQQWQSQIEPVASNHAKPQALMSRRLLEYNIKLVRLSATPMGDIFIRT